MKKALLMGAISPFCDLVRELKKLNIEPIICDYYSDAPAKKMGCRSYDTSTTDEKAILELAKNEDVDGIICAFSDRNLMPAYNVCRKLNYNHFFSEEIIKCLTDKILMKSFFSSKGYPIVKYAICNFDEVDGLEKEIHFPVLTKPIDAYGSKGIFLCKTLDDIKNNLNKVIRQSLNYDNQIIVEEYYRSDEISISAWVKEGHAYITCIYDVFRNIGDTVTLSAVSFPSKYTGIELENFDRLINKVISDIQIEEGPVTLQCFIGEGGIRLSELLCRLAGGSPYLYSCYLGGPNVAKMMLEYSVNDAIDYQNLTDFRPIIPDSEVFYDIQVMVGSAGVLHYELDIDYIMDNNAEIVDIITYYSDGAEISNLSSSGVLFAKVICKTERRKSYTDLITRIDNEISVYNEAGDKISFVPVPERFDVVNSYSINWEFLNIDNDCKKK